MFNDDLAMYDLLMTAGIDRGNLYYKSFNALEGELYISTYDANCERLDHRCDTLGCTDYGNPELDGLAHVAEAVHSVYSGDFTINFSRESGLCVSNQFCLWIKGFTVKEIVNAITDLIKYERTLPFGEEFKYNGIPAYIGYTGGPCWVSNLKC